MVLKKRNGENMEDLSTSNGNGPPSAWTEAEIQAMLSTLDDIDRLLGVLETTLCRVCNLIAGTTPQ